MFHLIIAFVFPLGEIETNKIIIRIQVQSYEMNVFSRSDRLVCQE